MNAVVISMAQSTTLDRAIDAACRTIAPAWPLDRLIAVNPHWGRIAQGFGQAGAEVARLHGSRLWMDPEYYAEAWRNGEIRDEHLRQAIAETDPSLTPDELHAALAAPVPARPVLPLLSDAVDAARDEVHQPSWRETLLHQVSQHCAACFDRDQADWAHTAAGGLYASWREELLHDHGVAALMDAPALTVRAAALPDTPRDCVAAVVEALGIEPRLVADWLEAVLGRVRGWASWCAWLRWEASLGGRTDDALVELLAIRVAWEGLVDDGARGPGSAWHRWREDLARWAESQPPLYERAAPVWQRAHELAYQQRLLRSLQARPDLAAAGPRDEVQAVFCIDVRSEGLRRALERTGPGLRTLGFAGFFGLPVAYTPLGTGHEQRLLPGLLAPRVAATDRAASKQDERTIATVRHARLEAAAAWRPFHRQPVAAFARVETLGVFDLPRLLLRTLGIAPRRPPVASAGLRAAERARLHPAISADLATRVDLAAQVLQTMGLTRDFARVVLLAGHGSRSANNAHAASLECGACGGHAGDVSARVLARLLNDDDVRAGLRLRGIAVPDDTCFVAGLHETTTDDLTLFDTDAVPAAHRHDLERLRERITAACDAARSQRAASLGLEHLAGRPRRLRAALERRATDWSETRPEWGLAGNAAFIAAPRARTADVDLGGRAFLHEYDWRSDADGRVLETILTAPVVVAHWINLQYFASTVDPARYGSGNKLLHNVVGGRLGVFEGNGGDLRIGLPWQSIHDGQRWRHEPLRLTVVVDAPRARIDDVLGKHAVVRELVEHRWLHLVRCDGAGFEARGAGGWTKWSL